MTKTAIVMFNLPEIRGYSRGGPTLEEVELAGG